ncbi:MAG: ABC transporter permease [Candidatus Kapabacteria bacterium]|nr:ABC transporter permease [Candidatus Kapabacteria bacterium]
MRTILFLIQKEFLQIRRNKQMLPIIFFVPIVQLLVLVFAANFEVKLVYVTLVDYDKSSSSRSLVDKFASTGRFKFVSDYNSEKLAFQEIDKNIAKMALIIPRGFERNISRSEFPEIQIILNAVDGAAAGIIQNYAAQIIYDYNKELVKSMRLIQTQPTISTITVKERYWYNPELNFKFYMVPGILVVLVTIIGMFLTSMNIVKEKEMGTIEQLNVTPIKKYQFITGKLVPFWIIAMFDLALGLFLGKVLFHIPIVGNIFLIFGLASIYLIVALSFALFVSTVTETQQQAMFISWFFVVIFILMSGLFTPIESMPHWAQIVTLFNPISHFIEIMRRVILKGAGFFDVLQQVWILTVYGMVMLILSVWRYRKVSS